jgi:preprotein translocase subunit SecA
MYKRSIDSNRRFMNLQTCYPERNEQAESWSDRIGAYGEWVFFHRWRTNGERLRAFVGLVDRAGEKWRDMTDEGLKSDANTLRTQFRQSGFQDELVAQSFAIVREIADRKFGMRHFDTQLMCGLALLKGMVVEMATGEGKTLCATLPACTAALAGIPVHIITVNDYLVSRDASWMSPIYQMLGLSVGQIVHGMDSSLRRTAYACDITYCNNKELVFDYLKDRILIGSNISRTHLEIENLYKDYSRKEHLLLRGLHFAIVDEADSVLVDEARTPLIISSEKRNCDYNENIYRQAIDLAASLNHERDFKINELEGVVLTEHGKSLIEKLAEPLGSIWMSNRSREELVTVALLAQHRYIKDKHYLVSDGKVQIIDEYTGRTMPDRFWEGNLHQMIEVKEGCSASRRHETIARITYQRFFRRYIHLAGMTGTVKEVARELWIVYRLKMIKLPTNRPLCRRYLPAQIYSNAADKWAAIVEHVADIHKNKKRPVLIGTRSVEASEFLSRLFEQAGLPHQVLNARQDKQEAEIISKAGEIGKITVATNMAGRGTDIKLGEDVAEIGGLHVVLTERHDARRIDRQLFGRCARQGDPGSCIAIVSLEDELVFSYVGRLPKIVRKTIHAGMLLFRERTSLWLLHAAQMAAERLHSQIRRNTLELDKKMDRMLAFTGRIE